MGRSVQILPRSTTSLLSIVAILLAAAAPAHAQAVIRGIVIEDGTSLPIVTVDIQFRDSSGVLRARSLSDEEGRFRVEVADSGTYSMSVRRVGYASAYADSIPIGEGEELDIEIRLDPRAVVLDAITVVVNEPFVPSRIIQYQERADFNRRAGIGRIYMRDDLARLQPNSAQEVLDRILWGASCRPLILLDGLPFDGPMTMIHGEEVEGIEIYRGLTQIPPEYYRYGMCGLALVWSRTDPPGMKPFSWKRLGFAGLLVALIGLVVR
jgi:hypothetical protein